MAKQSPVGQGNLIIGASRLHSGTPQSEGLLYTSDRSDAENSSWQHKKTHNRHPYPRRDFFFYPFDFIYTV